MRITKTDIEVKMQIPGATVRQHTGFGEAGAFGTMGAEFFSLAAGVDTTPLFQGLEGDLCQCPHWGYVLQGRVTTTDAEGARETVAAGDLFHWPAGHNVLVEEDAELIMFSPQKEHTTVIDHMRSVVAGPSA